MNKILYFTENSYELTFDGLNVETYDTNIDFLNIQSFLSNTNEVEYLMSDNIDFLVLMYRLYHNTFHSFIYVETQEKNKNDFVEYQVLLNKPILKEECITKPIYVLNADNPKTKIELSFQYINDILEINHSINTVKKPQKIFLLNNGVLVTEYINFNFQFIHLDNTFMDDMKFDIDHFINLDSYSNTQISNIMRLFTSNKDVNENLLIQLEKHLNKLSQLDFNRIIVHLKFLMNNMTNLSNKYLFDSFLLSLDLLSSEMMDDLIIEVINNESLEAKNKYFLLWQYLRFYFVQNIQKKPQYKNLWLLYRNIFQEYAILFNSLNYISKEERNKNLIILVTGQFLTEEHAPTMFTLERAYHLIKDFEKDVLIINTADFAPVVGYVNFYNAEVGNKISDYTNFNQIQYKDVYIPFYQSSVDMPNETEIVNILSIIQEYKPYFVLNIGSANLTADLCSKILTTVSLPTTVDLAISESQIHIDCNNDINKEKEMFLKDICIDQRSIIKSDLAYSEIMKTKTFKKQDFKLPEDKFLIAIIGNRLDSEITEEFVDVLIDILEFDVYFVFIGKFDTYEKHCKNNSLLRKNSIFLGRLENLYSIMNIFDLVLNPPRIGGGTVAYWSILNEVPLLTLNHGDANNITQNKFSVKNYEEMKKEIEKYLKNKDFYDEKVKLASELSQNMNTIKN